jgi:hypothetical protein
MYKNRDGHEWRFVKQHNFLSAFFVFSVVNSYNDEVVPKGNTYLAYENREQKTAVLIIIKEKKGL